MSAALDPKLPSTDEASVEVLPAEARAERRTRRKRERDLGHAITLRPADVFRVYGIPESTLCVMCRNPDKEKRPPSILIPGRRGRRGVRLFEKALFEAWYKKFRC